MMRKLSRLAIPALSFMLISCGGSSVSSNYVIPADLQTTLVTPTYAPGSEELAAFNAINVFRNMMGLGYWEQHALLDQAAQNHITYSIANDPSFQEVLEVEGKVGFTGITPSARAIHTGYFVVKNNQPTAAVGEFYATGTGADVVNSMINTIYHRSGLLAQSTRTIGLARDTVGVATPATHWWINHGRLDDGQRVASNYLSFYPKDQQTGVPLSMTPEFPSVYSNQANFNFATQTTSPVSFVSAVSTSLKITSFTVTPAGSNTPLAGTVWTLLNDPNLTENNPDNSTPISTIAGYEAYWVGDTPFLPNTTYNVHVTGSTTLIEHALTHDFEQAWSFSTGS